MIHGLLLDLAQSTLWVKPESPHWPPWDLDNASVAPWPPGTICTVHEDYVVSLFSLISFAKKIGSLKVILFKRRNWWWSQIACMQFSLAASPVFLNPGNIKQWEATLVLAKNLNIFERGLTPLWVEAQAWVLFWEAIISFTHFHRGSS